MDKFIHGNLDSGNSENGLCRDVSNPTAGQTPKLLFKGGCIGRRNFNEQAAIDLREYIRGLDIQFQPEASADAHFCGGDGETSLAEIMCGSDQSA